MLSSSFAPHEFAAKDRKTNIQRLFRAVSGRYRYLQYIRLASQTCRALQNRVHTSYAVRQTRETSAIVRHPSYVRICRAAVHTCEYGDIVSPHYTMDEFASRALLCPFPLKIHSTRDIFAHFYFFPKTNFRHCFRKHGPKNPSIISTELGK